jgi:hypothetical protein
MRLAKRSYDQLMPGGMLAKRLPIFPRPLLTQHDGARFVVADDMESDAVDPPMLTPMAELL